MTLDTGRLTVVLLGAAVVKRSQPSLIFVNLPTGTQSTETKFSSRRPPPKKHTYFACSGRGAWVRGECTHYLPHTHARTHTHTPRLVVVLLLLLLLLVVVLLRLFVLLLLLPADGEGM